MVVSEVVEMVIFWAAMTADEKVVHWVAQWGFQWVESMADVMEHEMVVMMVA